MSEITLPQQPTHHQSATRDQWRKKISRHLRVQPHVLRFRRGRLQRFLWHLVVMVLAGSLLLLTAQELDIDNIFLASLFLYAPIALIAAWSDSYVAQRRARQPLSEVDLERGIENVFHSGNALLILDLRRRAHALRSFAVKIMMGVAALIVVAVVYFGIAGRIFDVDANRKDPVEEAKLALLETNRLIDRASANMMNAQTQAQIGQQDLISALLQQRQNLSTTYLDLLQQYTPEAIARTQDVTATRVLWTNITRFGGTILILYLIAILIPILRYSLQLSTHYHSRADAFMVQTGNTENVEKVAALLAADKIAVGRPPRNLIERIIEVWWGRNSAEGGRTTSGARGRKEKAASVRTRDGEGVGNNGEKQESP